MICLNSDFKGVLLSCLIRFILISSVLFQTNRLNNRQKVGKGLEKTKPCLLLRLPGALIIKSLAASYLLRYKFPFSFYLWSIVIYIVTYQFVFLQFFSKPSFRAALVGSLPRNIFSDEKAWLILPFISGSLELGDIYKWDYLTANLWHTVNSVLGQREVSVMEFSKNSFLVGKVFERLLIPATEEEISRCQT